MAGRRWLMRVALALMGLLLVLALMALQSQPRLPRIGSLMPSLSFGHLVIVAAVLGALVIWFVPKWQVRGVSVSRFELENEARRTVAQIVGGLALLGGLYFTSETLRVGQQGQITDRFTKAISQLGELDAKGGKKLEVRLGGIYALERIAKGVGAGPRADHGDTDSLRSREREERQPVRACVPRACVPRALEGPAARTPGAAGASHDRGAGAGGAAAGTGAGYGTQRCAMRSAGSSAGCASKNRGARSHEVTLGCCATR